MPTQPPPQAPPGAPAQGSRAPPPPPPSSSRSRGLPPAPAGGPPPNMNAPPTGYASSSMNAPPTGYATSNMNAPPSGYATSNMPVPHTGYSTSNPNPGVVPNNTRSTERSPLLAPPYQAAPSQSSVKPPADNTKARSAVWALLALIFVGALILFVGFGDSEWVKEVMPRLVGKMPRDPVKAASWLLDQAPVIDGHIDLPYLVRERYSNNATSVDLTKKMPGAVDIPRLKEGKVGGFFWSVYVPCADKKHEGRDYTGASWRVRDTLEQIDISRQLISANPNTFQLALSAYEITHTISKGLIASLLGVEGGHQLGTSLAVLRMYYDLGVRYVALTQACHNPFADASGSQWGDIEPRWGGLSKFGFALITEMNRLGMIIDLSYSSDETAYETIKLSRAPVIWSNSNARALRDLPRNVPNDILDMIGQGEGKKDGVVMVNFAPFYIADKDIGEEATLERVADHIEHIAKVAGKKHVGIGSNFNGIEETPEGLEDVSKYPALITELIKRGWNANELAGLTGGNFLRVFKGVERVARDMKEEGEKENQEVYWKRKDL